MPSTVWNDDDREWVAAHLRLGWSAAQIARAYDCTRNAAVGRISRDDQLHALIQKRSRPRERPDALTPPPTKALPAVSPPPKQPTPPPPRRSVPVVLPPMKLVPLTDLTLNSCKWPVKEDHTITGYFLFCGRAIAPGSIYCSAHFALAHAARNTDG